MRNYTQKMTGLTKRTDLPIEIRKKICNNILKMRTDITCAVKYRKSEDKSLYQQISGKFSIINNKYYNKYII